VTAADTSTAAAAAAPDTVAPEENSKSQHENTITLL